MKLLTSVCGVIVALAIVGTATGQATGQFSAKTNGEEVKTVPFPVYVLIDAKTKSITKAAKIKQFETLNESAVTKKSLDNVKAEDGKNQTHLNGTYVVHDAKITLQDGGVVKCQVLVSNDPGKKTLRNVKYVSVLQAVSDKATGTWYCYTAEYDTPAPEDIAAVLQGTWRGVIVPGREGVALYITFVVKFNKMTMTDANPDQKSTKEGTVKLDPKTKAFDWTDEKNGWIGIYELKGDDFKFYAVPMAAGEDKRPKSFDDKGGQLFVLKRAAAEPKETIAQTKKEMEGLQGTWRESEMQKVVVKGDRLSRIDSRPGQEETIQGTITINPNTKAIDWPMETGLAAGVTMRGIYELKGNNLRIILVPGGRPKTFDEKDGWLLVLKREKP